MAPVRARCSCSSEADLLVPDELPSADCKVWLHCAGHQMATQVTVSDRRKQESYDPCSPANVQPASDLQVAETDLAMLSQQLSGLRSMLSRREKSDPDSTLVQDYRRRVQEMTAQLAEADKRAAALGSPMAASSSGSCHSFDVASTSSPASPTHKRLGSSGSTSTACPSVRGADSGLEFTEGL